MNMYLCINLTTDNWLTIISLVFVAVGGIFIYLQWHKSLKTRRAEFINQILEKLRFDEDLPKSMYIIDYNQGWYDGSFHTSDLEISIDKLFSYVDYICYLKATRNISSTNYLWNLYHFSMKNETTCSFQYLIDYGIDCKLFSNDFKKNKSLYPKTLNF